MPPKVKFQKEQIVKAAFDAARNKGIESVTAREVADVLGVSTRPIFTYYDSMDQLRQDVCAMAKELYIEYLSRGLEEEIPFLGVGHQYIRFARQEPELYKLLFMTRPQDTGASAMEALKMTQDLVRESVMRIYNMDCHAADCYYRNLWLVVFSFATLIVTDDCPYTDQEMSDILSEVSLCICKAYKEVPGLTTGDYDRDAIFSELVKKPMP